MPSVMQEWVNDLTFMQQSVIITAIRGCDGLPKIHVSKYVLRWFRRCVLLSAFDKCVLTDPHDQRGGNFTGPLPSDVTFQDICAQYVKDVDCVPHHFHLHLMHASEILGYKHPNIEIRKEWRAFYEKLVCDMHLTPETEAQLDFRLGDSKAQWQKVGGEELLDRKPHGCSVTVD